MSDKPSHNAKNIGARFRSARSLVISLNRKSFCERYEINRYTMQSWENGLHVSKGKNVEKFITALAHEGIACTAEWLIDGTGEPARPFNDQRNEEKITSETDLLEDPMIEKMIALYAEQGQNLVSCHIYDEAMAPWFRTGDRVFGLDISNDPTRAHQKWCIVDLGDDRQVVRKVIHFKDYFILGAEDKRVPTFTLKVEAAAIYEVVWHLVRQ